MRSANSWQFSFTGRFHDVQWLHVSPLQLLRSQQDQQGDRPLFPQPLARLSKNLMFQSGNGNVNIRIWHRTSRYEPRNQTRLPAAQQNDVSRFWRPRAPALTVAHVLSVPPSQTYQVCDGKRPLYKASTLSGFNSNAVGILYLFFLCPCLGASYRSMSTQQKYKRDWRQIQSKIRFHCSLTRLCPGKFRVETCTNFKQAGNTAI